MPQFNTGGSPQGFGFQPFPWWLFSQIYGGSPPSNLGTGGMAGPGTQGLYPTTTPYPTPYYTSPSGLDFSGGQLAGQSPTLQAPPAPYQYDPSAYGQIGAPSSLPDQQTQQAQAQLPPPPNVGGVTDYPGNTPGQGLWNNPFASNYMGGPMPQWLQDLGGVLFNQSVPSSPFLGGLATPANWGLSLGVSGAPGQNVGGSETNKREALQTLADTGGDINMGNYWLNTFGYIPPWVTQGGGHFGGMLGGAGPRKL